MINLRDSVVTLPITPTSNPNIGLMVIPFVMDVLAKRMDLDRVLALNVNGAKLYSKNVENHVLGFLESNRKLGILPNFVWRDDQKENIFWINKFFMKLFEEGHIIKESAEIMRCDCRAVESLFSADNFSYSRRIYHEESGKKICNLCASEVIKSIEDCYLFIFPDISGSINAYPSFYGNELLNMATRFHGLKFLISRSRNSSCAIWTGHENIFLDVDFIWQMFLPLLKRYGFNPKILIGSTKNILACCFSMAMLKLIDEQEIRLVIPPYYLATKREKIKGDNYKFSRFVDYGDKTLRLFLSTAINWSRKETVLDFRLLDIISKIICKIESGKSMNVENLDEILVDFDGRKMKDILIKARRSRDLFVSKELKGIL